VTSAAIFHENWCHLHLADGCRCGCFSTDVYDVAPDVLVPPDAGAMNLFVDALAGDLIQRLRADGFQVVPRTKSGIAFGASVGRPGPERGVVLIVLGHTDTREALLVLGRHGAEVWSAAEAAPLPRG
jgi:hypothetical protein